MGEQCFFSFQRLFVFSFVKCILCFAFASLQTSPSQAFASQNQGRALITIKKMIGSATVKRGDKEVAAKPKLILKVGDIITTSPKGLLVIVFADGSEHTVLQNTTIKVQDVVVVEDSESLNLVSALKMVRGRARFFFKPRESRRNSKVKTHNSTLGVRGTSFLVDNKNLQDTHVVVFKGEVSAQNNARPGAEVSISSGQYSRVAGAQAPTTPKALTSAQLATVLNEESSSESFYEQEETETEQDKEPEQRVEPPGMEITLWAQIATAADYIYSESENEEGSGFGGRFLWRPGLGGTSLHIGFDRASFNEANLRTLSLGVGLGYSFLFGQWFAFEPFLGGGIRRLENQENLDIPPLEGLGVVPEGAPQLKRWDEDQIYGFFQYGAWLRIPSTSTLGFNMGFVAPRMILPEEYKAVLIRAGLSLAL